MDEEKRDSRPGIGYLIYTLCVLAYGVIGISAWIYAFILNTPP